ncbi:alpha/beta hydrolase family protein [Bradyrhizobium tunisiense]|uniref:alpha/beta hydrolase family protein n=1 Tax=Bradyrhizobium tunisiense TaxID=3278709 RepID=UPI0035E2F51F
MDFGVRGDLASARQSASAFLDSLPKADDCAQTVRQSWVDTWTMAGEAYCRVADLHQNKKEFDKATEAWLCALTALEVARRLVPDDDTRSADVSAKVEAGLQRIGLSSGHEVESVQIACGDLGDVLASYLPARAPNSRAPAVICVSSEGETGATLLGRLLPVIIGRGMSVLVVSHGDVADRARGESEIVLAYCLDYLSARTDVDSSWIGVYGDGLSAALATDFAAYDRRIAAAVCDGGVWKWTRSLSSIGWMTPAADGSDNDAMSAHPRLARRLNCPVLVVAGGRGVVSVVEAIKLQAVCMAARIDVDLVMPQLIQGGQGEEVDNFVTSDERIFRWLEQKLARDPALKRFVG